MSSEIQICNLALSHLGVHTINSLSDASQEARKCSLYYAPARDFVLADFPWNFAERRNYLALLSGITPLGFLYAYQYPVDCLDIRGVYDYYLVTKAEYLVNVSADLASKQIFTNQETAAIIYTAKVTNVNLFDEAFKTALSYKLAADLVPSLVKKDAVFRSMMAAYVTYLNNAKARNASESKEPEDTSNTFADARG